MGVSFLFSDYQKNSQIFLFFLTAIRSLRDVHQLFHLWDENRYETLSFLQFLNRLT